MFLTLIMPILWDVSSFQIGSLNEREETYNKSGTQWNRVNLASVDKNNMY